MGVERWLCVLFGVDFHSFERVLLPLKIIRFGVGKFKLASYVKVDLYWDLRCQTIHIPFVFGVIGSGNIARFVSFAQPGN